MTLDMPKVTFFLRSNNDLNQSHVIYCRVSYLGTKAEFSLKEKINPKEWDQNNQSYKGSKKSTQIFISSLLEKTAVKIKSCALYSETKTAKLLIRETFKKKRMASIEELIIDYIDSQKEKAPGTLRNHRVKLENFKEFQRITKQKHTHLSFCLVEAENFKRWFKMRAGTKNKDTANRHILFFRAAILHAQKKGDVKDFPLFFYTGEKDAKKDNVFLTAQDIAKMTMQRFKSPMLTKVRDLFIFQCYTGLSYGDLWGGWKVYVRFDTLIIQGTRKKNSECFIVPLENEALEILKKYSGVLPRYTNEVYNRILKEIAAICGIEKRITTHTARKTFATVMNSRGWSRESVADMLGHRSIRTTELYYLGRDFQRIENELLLRVS